MTFRRAVVLLAAAFCLGSRPLVSDPPRSSVLTVRVQPPLDPDRMPWRIQLLAPGGGMPELVEEAPSPSSRALELTTRPDRPYLLRLLTNRGDIWMTDAEPFVVGEGKARILAPKAETVRGSVAVGRSPLGKAWLTFSSEGRRESVALEADEKGIVSGVLPRLGSWHVAVSSAVPRLHREVDADVLRNRRGNELDFEIGLAPRGIEGEFVDLEGERITNRVVLWLDQQAQPRDHQDLFFEGGTFKVDWLGEGEHLIEVHASRPVADGRWQLLRSEPIAVSVVGGTADPAWLTVRMRRSSNLKGRVVGANGAGIPKARVPQIAWTGSMVALTRDVVTDAEGRFVLPFLEGMEDACVAVAAPGLAVSLQKIVPTTDEVVVPVEGPGGTLILDQPYLGASRLGGRIVTLFRKGCGIRPGLHQGPGYRGPRPERADIGARWRFTLPQLEPGPYSACAVTLTELGAYRGGPPAFADCVHGTLPPAGTLELSLLP